VSDDTRLNGRFRPGFSGNPGGKPKELRDIQHAARAHSAEAIAALVKIARDGRSESARVQAATAILDRGFGKPAQTVHRTNQDVSRLSDAEIANLLREFDPRDPAPEGDQDKLN
jgi:hypothetical protein